MASSTESEGQIECVLGDEAVVLSSSIAELKGKIAATKYVISAIADDANVIESLTERLAELEVQLKQALAQQTEQEEAATKLMEQHQAVIQTHVDKWQEMVSTFKDGAVESPMTDGKQSYKFTPALPVLERVDQWDDVCGNYCPSFESRVAQLRSDSKTLKDDIESYCLQQRTNYERQKVALGVKYKTVPGPHAPKEELMVAYLTLAKIVTKTCSEGHGTGYLITVPKGMFPPLHISPEMIAKDKREEWLKISHGGQTFPEQFTVRTQGLIKSYRLWKMTGITVVPECRDYDCPCNVHDCRSHSYYCYCHVAKCRTVKATALLDFQPDVVRKYFEPLLELRVDHASGEYFKSG